MKTEVFKYKEGRYLHKLEVKTVEVDGLLYLHFPYNKKFLEEVKCFEGRKWCGPAGTKAPPEIEGKVATRLFKTNKVWAVPLTPRNIFQFDYLFGRDPYKPFDAPLIDFKPTRPLYEHQIELAAFGLTRHYAIWAAEMGTGKTLAAIEVMENSQILDWWYVAPRSALKAVEREFRIWNFKLRPHMATYDDLRREMQNWLSGRVPPQGVIFDESSRIKNPTAQRSQAAMALANGVRTTFGKNGFVILMSGSPAPKSPVDWWHQCEVAQPGFIREGDIQKFQLRLGLFEQRESFAGGVFNQRVTWLDDEKKCKVCGHLEDDVAHDPNMLETYHPYQPSVNEVAHLYKRMKGLVVVKFKSDCLDLPEKIYREIECKPRPDTLRAARLISGKAKNVITAMTLLRELSDGFQYIEKVDGKQTCEICRGTRQYVEPTGFIPQTIDANTADFEIKPGVCPYCDENGQQDKIIRIAKEVPCPKDEALTNLLDEHSEVGRLVIYAGFTGSVDRCVKICQAQEWSVVRVDGRGWWCVDSKGNGLQGDPLTIFQDDFQNHPRVAFIGQPGAAGMGLTLTASPTICYWSNDFNAESRIQSEDRIHRPGISKTRGATIIDFLHLPTDKTVLDNLKNKRRLQDMSLGSFQKILEEAGDERIF